METMFVEDELFKIQMAPMYFKPPLKIAHNGAGDIDMEYRLIKSHPMQPPPSDNRCIIPKELTARSNIISIISTKAIQFPVLTKDQQEYKCSWIIKSAGTNAGSMIVLLALDIKTDNDDQHENIACEDKSKPTIRPNRQYCSSKDGVMVSKIFRNFRSKEKNVRSFSKKNKKGKKEYSKVCYNRLCTGKKCKCLTNWTDETGVTDSCPYIKCCGCYGDCLNSKICDQFNVSFYDNYPYQIMIRYSLINDG